MSSELPTDTTDNTLTKLRLRLGLGLGFGYTSVYAWVFVRLSTGRGGYEEYRDKLSKYTSTLLVPVV